MNEPEVRAKLEGALHRPILTAEWRRLKRLCLVDEYSRDELPWAEFVDLVQRDLKELGTYLEERSRELAGELESEDEEARLDQVSAPSSLGGRASARSRALASLNRFRTGGRSSGGSALNGSLMPRGGRDGTLAQWVYLLAVELWVPAEEVANHYRSLQKTMSAEWKPPKTSERAFKVAAFVWDNEMVDGTRAPWPELCERWNRWPLTKPFDDWRHFRMAFKRGEKATPPRYVASNEQITKQVRSGGQEILDDWASKIRG
jgi:hypothetical protein